MPVTITSLPAAALSCSGELVAASAWVGVGALLSAAMAPAGWSVDAGSATCASDGAAATSVPKASSEALQ